MASIIVSEKTGPQVPAGTHVATCFRIVDLGLQPDTGFGEKEKLVLFFELPHERIVIDGKEVPMGISKFYTKSLGKRASLRKDLEAWRGRPFTKEELEGFKMEAILGKSCQLQVIDDEGKSKIAAIVGLPKGTDVPPAQNPLVEYSVSEGRESPKFAKLPEWVRTMAEQCAEWNPSSQSKPAQPAAEPDDSDMVPF